MLDNTTGKGRSLPYESVAARGPVQPKLKSGDEGER